MKVKLLLGLISAVMILSFTGCKQPAILVEEQLFSTTPPGPILPMPTPTLAIVDKNETMVINYLKDKGYNIVENYGKVTEYVLTKERLIRDAKTVWAVQTINADDYLGKIIKIYGCEVTNHPVSKNDSVDVLVMVFENRIIGGYSERTYSTGWNYSLEGKTPEEVTGMNLNDWMKQWDAKYK